MRAHFNVGCFEVILDVHDDIRFFDELIRLGESARAGQVNERIKAEQFEGWGERGPQQRVAERGASNRVGRDAGWVVIRMPADSIAPV